MYRIFILLFVCLVFAFCQTEQQPQRAQSNALQKIYYKNPEELQKLRQAGVEIIVQQPDYVIVRNDSALQAQGLKSEPIKESDLVERLVKIYPIDSTDLQTVVNSGVDLWQVKGDTAIARAYDIYIDRLRKAGLSVTIIAKNASKMEEK
jgi:hypothetical protein